MYRVTGEWVRELQKRLHENEDRAIDFIVEAINDAVRQDRAQRAMEVPHSEEPPTDVYSDEYLNDLLGYDSAVLSSHPDLPMDHAVRDRERLRLERGLEPYATFVREANKYRENTDARIEPS